MIDNGATPDARPLPAANDLLAKDVLVEVDGEVVSNPLPGPDGTGPDSIRDMDPDELVATYGPEVTGDSQSDAISADTPTETKKSPTGTELFTDEQGRTVHDIPDRPQRGQDF